MAAPKKIGEKHDERTTVVMQKSFRIRLDLFAEARATGLSEVLRDGAEVLMNGRLPVLGRIPCGPLAVAIEATPYHEVAPPMMRPRADLGDYLLEASGDSMAPHISDGDLVMLRPDVDWSNGEVCAVQIYHDKGNDDCEATLKRVFWETGREKVTLRAYNGEYKDMTFEAEQVKVVGVFRGLLRRDG